MSKIFGRSIHQHGLINVEIPLRRYFLLVGGALLVALFAVDAITPRQPAFESGNPGPRLPRIRIHSELKGPEAVVIAERGRMISGSLRAKVLMRALSSNATRPTEDFTHFTRLLSARTILDQTLGLKFERDQGEEGG